MPDILDVVVRDRKDFLAERFSWRGIRDRTWQREYLGSELMAKQLFKDSLRSSSRIEIARAIFCILRKLLQELRAATQ